MTLPRATYRLQFRDGMTFARAADLAPYWQRLGISHLYASPVFAARRGSSHGYDVIDHNRLEPSLGGEEGFFRLSAALRRRDLGLILDIVPNHMCAVAENGWWRNVLEWGRRSPYAGHFDIDWTAGDLILPVLGRPYDEVLARGGLTVTAEADPGVLAFAYHDHVIPLSPPTYAPVLAATGDATLTALAETFARASPASVADAQQALAQAMRESVHRDALATTVQAIAADRARIDRLHAMQVWRLTFWQEGRHRLTYRRFFEITDLVGVRVERPAVFDDVHRLLCRLAAEGHVDGVRVDHVDGLADPTAYLRRLREAIGPDTYLVVEKILADDETLRADWPVDGTTGYEFIADMARLMCDTQQAAALTARYQDFIRQPVEYDKVVQAAKHEILTHNLAAELGWLVRDAERLTRADGPRAEDLRRAIIALICHFPRYRTYVDADGPDKTDAALIARVAAAARSTGHQNHAAIDAVTRLLSLQVPDGDRGPALAFVRRFQQTTGPVMAKAVEDTAFYRYNRLIGLNEVGGDPVPAKRAPTTCLHGLAAGDRAARSMAATATHDTKRGEDARVRLYVLSEAPQLWADAVDRWAEMNAGLRPALDDGPAPGRNTEWLIYQALYAAWPADPREHVGDLVDRLPAFVEKAVREAKQRSSWLAPNAAYERAVRRYVAGLLASGNRVFQPDFIATCAPLWRAGMLNSLAQVLLKVTGPRVPDIYQGTEFWDLSMVDPDNRRAVDFGARARRLDVDAVRDPWAAWHDGSLKLHVLRAALRARASAPRLYAEGSFEPLTVAGPRRAHAAAFLRRLDGQAALIVVPRHVVSLLDDAEIPRIDPQLWGGTEIELPSATLGARFTDRLSGRITRLASRIQLSGILDAYPVALLQI